MKQNAILVATSLLSILLLTLHITDDIVRGISKAESSNTALAVLVVLLYGTLVLNERRSGHVIMLLVGLLAAAMPVMHMRGTHYPDIAMSAGGFFFVWTLWALGGGGGLTFVLASERIVAPATKPAGVGMPRPLGRGTSLWLRARAGAAAAARAVRAATASRPAGSRILLGHLKLLCEAGLMPALTPITHRPRVHYTPPAPIY